MVTFRQIVPYWDLTTRPGNENIISLGVLTGTTKPASANMVDLPSNLRLVSKKVDRIEGVVLTKSCYGANSKPVADRDSVRFNRALFGLASTASEKRTPATVSTSIVTIGGTGNAS